MTNDRLRLYFTISTLYTTVASTFYTVGQTETRRRRDASPSADSAEDTAARLDAMGLVFAPVADDRRYYSGTGNAFINTTTEPTILQAAINAPLADVLRHHYGEKVEPRRSRDTTTVSTTKTTEETRTAVLARPNLSPSTTTLPAMVTQPTST